MLKKKKKVRTCTKNLQSKLLATQVPQRKKNQILILFPCLKSYKYEWIPNWVLLRLDKVVFPLIWRNKCPECIAWIASGAFWFFYGGAKMKEMDGCSLNWYSVLCVWTHLQVPSKPVVFSSWAVNTRDLSTTVVWKLVIKNNANGSYENVFPSFRLNRTAHASGRHMLSLST